MFDVRGLTVRRNIGGDERIILDSVDLSLAMGEVVDIVGPSGSGKSTLLTALAWMEPRATGSFLLDGRPREEFGPWSWRVSVALHLQRPALVGATVRESLLVPWSLSVRHDSPAPSTAQLRGLLDEVGLEDVEFDREVDRLSVGQQARVALVRAVAANPRVLLLDEADAALDPDSTHAVSALTKRFVSHAERAVIRVRHRLSDGIADRTLRLDRGRLEVVS